MSRIADYFMRKIATTELRGIGVTGRPVASGIYFYIIRAGTYTETKKMALLK